MLVSPKHKTIGVPAAPGLVNLFPKGRVVTFNGVPTLLLPHDPLHTFTLRQHGLDVPAPVLTQYPFKSADGKPVFDVQRHTVAMMTTTARSYVLNGMGCVDATTEYLSPEGWVPIADYQGGKVAQYDPQTGAIEFVEPTQYVKLPCAEMIRFKTTRGVDQLLSPEHRVLLADGRVMHAVDIERTYGSNASKKYDFPCTFTVTGTPGVNASDDMLRLHVAVSADGHQPRALRTYVRLKKPRKIARLRQLLVAAGVPFNEAPTVPAGFVKFTFNAPFKKGFGVEWWKASQKQLEVISSEATHWDGTFRKAEGLAFCTRDKASADFIQYAYSASGRRATLFSQSRLQSFDYTVHAKHRKNTAGLYGHNAGVLRQNVWREPSPDGFKYCFMVPSTFLLFRRNGCVFASGNTGKTRCALWAFDYLKGNGLATRMLVVAPLSTLKFTWAAEVLRTLPHLKVGILHGTRERRVATLADMSYDIYVINHDGMKILGDELRARPDIDTLCIDELAVYRNGGNSRSKDMMKYAKRMKWVWGMTGSPTPREPTDAWSQCRIVNPHVNVPAFFKRFRDATMYKVTNFKWEAKPDALDYVHRIMQPAVRFTLDDVVELPELVERTVRIELSKKQDGAYTRLRDHALAQIDNHTITAVNAGAVLNKMLQVSTGWVYTSKGDVIPLENEKRIEALVDVVTSAANKILVFVPYKHAMHGVAEALTKEGFDVATVSGDTPARQRGEIFHLFQNTNRYKVIVAHPQCLAHGITLTAADTVVWFAPTMDLEIFSQANARIRRVGQKNKQLLLYFASTPVELKAYRMLRKKENLQTKLLQMFADSTEDELT